MDGKIVFYIDHELREALELYIIDNDLDRKKVTLSKLANQIVQEWIKDPILNEKDIFFSYRKGYAGRVRRLTIFLAEDYLINLRRFYVRNYLRKISSENMMLANVLEQWGIKNIPGYDEKFRKKLKIDECEKEFFR
ncbi:hypothetical protein NSA50_16790 [Clostridium sp. DSM 100503]|uniref:hypothetical protein n=1 Tax=Clostridium sp. DSM 100503 TaxID=2963282 RepID=UPI002149D936|nr:hypothetical protein [Clostridium sp. DSM 100503]MCR1952684.1 hypothetical protein [Clostridium sp. DSM 100503]